MKDKMNIREMADHYRNLYHQSKMIEEEMKDLKEVLIDKNVNEYFLKEKEKVVLQEGSVKTLIDPGKASEVLTFNEFIQAVSVSEAAINRLDIEKGRKAEVIQRAKTIVGTGSPTVKVGKMNKKELEEMTK